jgi:hypothetical protein
MTNTEIKIVLEKTGATADDIKKFSERFDVELDYVSGGGFFSWMADN